jgi:hypothetical protein
MSNPKCLICGHINLVGAMLCDMCGSNLGTQRADYDSSRPFSAGDTPPREGALPTDIPSPYFKGVGDVVSPTLEIYRKHFLLVGALVFVAALPVVFLQYGSYILVAAQTAAMDLETASFSDPEGAAIVSLAALYGAGAAVLTILVSMAGNAFLTGALVYGVVELQRTGEAKIGDCISWGVRKFPIMFVANLLYWLILMVGYVLLVVPGVIFSLMFCLTMTIVAAEARGPIDALKRSYELTKGYKGLVFLTFFLWGILIFVLTTIVNGSFAFAGNWYIGSLLIQTLLSNMLQSSTIVLTIFIYLGLLNEARTGFSTRSFTSAPGTYGADASAR